MKILQKILFFNFLLLGSLSFSEFIIAEEDSKCKFSKWGADDEIGAANYVNEKKNKISSETC